MGRWIIGLGILDEAIIAIGIGIIVWVLVATSILTIELGLTIAIVSAIVLGILAYMILKPQLQTPQVGAETLIGKRVRAETRIAPTGLVTFDGVYWTAESAESIEAGEEVEVIMVDGTRLVVRKRAYGLISSGR